MVAARFMAFATLVGLAYAVAPTASGMQDEIDPVNRKPTGYFDVKRYKTEGIPDGKMNEAKARFVMFAKYNAEAISWPKRYAQLQDMTITLPPNNTIDGRPSSRESRGQGSGQLHPRAGQGPRR